MVRWRSLWIQRDLLLGLRAHTMIRWTFSQRYFSLSAFASDILMLISFRLFAWHARTHDNTVSWYVLTTTMLTRVLTMWPSEICWKHSSTIDSVDHARTITHLTYVTWCDMTTTMLTMWPSNIYVVNIIRTYVNSVVHTRTVTRLSAS